MSSTFYIIISLLAMNLLSGLGVLAWWWQGTMNEHWRRLCYALALGALLGSVGVHLLPEPWEHGVQMPEITLLLALGFGFTAGLNRLLHPRFGTNDGRKLALLALSAAASHRLLDGIFIGLSYQVNPTVGLAATAALLLHEIPQELGDYSLLLGSGMRLRQALGWSLMASATVWPGALLAIGLQDALASVRWYLPPVVAGSFVYLCTVILAPQLLKCPRESRPALLLAIAVGLGTMLATRLLGHSH